MSAINNSHVSFIIEPLYISTHCDIMIYEFYLLDIDLGKL